MVGGLPRWLSGKESACNAGNAGSTPESGRSPGGGNGNHSSILAWKIPDRGLWWAIVHGIAHRARHNWACTCSLGLSVLICLQVWGPGFRVRLGKLIHSSRETWEKLSRKKWSLGTWKHLQVIKVGQQGSPDPGRDVFILQKVRMRTKGPFSSIFKQQRFFPSSFRREEEATASFSCIGGEKNHSSLRYRLRNVYV